MRAYKKHIEVEVARIATLINDAENNWAALPKWVRDGYDQGKILFLPDRLIIRTLEGEMCGQFEDWLIQGVRGEMYACARDIFVQTYELV